MKTWPLSSWCCLHHAGKRYYSWPMNSLWRATWARKRCQSESCNASTGPLCSTMLLSTVGFAENARGLCQLASQGHHLYHCPSSMNPFNGWLWTLWVRCPEAILGTNTCLWYVIMQLVIQKPFHSTRLMPPYCRGASEGFRTSRSAQGDTYGPGE